MQGGRFSRQGGRFSRQWRCTAGIARTTYFQPDFTNFLLRKKGFSRLFSRLSIIASIRYKLHSGTIGSLARPRLRSQIELGKSKRLLQ